MHVAAHKLRPPLHGIERALLTVVGIHLAFLPWAFGTMHAWAQIVSLSLATIGFAISLFPRTVDSETTGGPTLRIHPWSRLIRFPLFWLGLGLLILLVAQSLNPSWEFRHDDRKWWLQRIEHAAWLPTSTATPFGFYNIWRSFLVYASAWLTVSALWVGITRRRSLQVLLYILAGNALLLTIVGIAHRIDGSHKILWLRHFKGATGFSGFVYHNHGAAYLGLLTLVLWALASWSVVEARRKMARSSPAFVWIIGALVLVVGVMYSGSRAGFGLLLMALIGALIASLFIRRMDAMPSTTPPAVSILLGAMVLGCLAFVVVKSDVSDLTTKFERLFEQGARDESYEARVLARDRAVQMYADHWLRGSGAGSFRFLYPKYISDSPALYEGGRAFWEHAHIDWLQIPIELGLIGVLLIAGGIGWCVWRCGRGAGWHHPVAVMLFLGCSQTLLHALIDFPFQNPAVLITWWTLLIVALRWLEFDEDVKPRIVRPQKWNAPPPSEPAHLAPLKLGPKPGQ